MMGRRITDAVESETPTVVEGLGLFDLDITFEAEKTLVNHGDGSYEVHHGQVTRNAEEPWIDDEGARRAGLFGTHRHGYLENDPARRAFLTEVAEVCGKNGFRVSPDTSFAGLRLRQLDLIADTLERHWDLDQLLDEVSIPDSVADRPVVR